MPALESYVRAARHSGARTQQKIVYRKPEPRFVDASVRSREIKEEKEQGGAGEDWEKCAHLKVSGGKHSCKKFFCPCAKDNCSKRHIELCEEPAEK